MCANKNRLYEPNLKYGQAVGRAKHGAKIGAVEYPAPSAEPKPSPWDLWEMEKKYIRSALEHFGGDKVRASDALGISLSSLYRKLNLMAMEV